MYQIYLITCTMHHLHHITSPPRITPRSRTLIDNIFSTEINDGITANNILTTISDHFAQVLSLPITSKTRKTGDKY